ncbi:MAG TPA: carboxypeptidase regulatory-like domain-containing protein, partial [Pyrinomonadaceae bacterium]
SPRREAVFRNVFLDEGGWQGITVHPGRYQSQFVPIDLFYVTNAYVNVSNFWTNGHYISGVDNALVENGLYTWSDRADSAIHILDAKDAIIDRVRTEKSATRLRAEYLTTRLTVIDSTYEDLASGAAQTIVLTPATPDDDPVRYVRSRFESVLGRGPDAAAHYYWSRRLLDCAADAACVTAQRAALAAHLAAGPAQTFAITGRATDENNQPLSGVAVTLSGSQSSQTTTGADGSYRFGRLPTSGVYTVTAGTKRHQTFTTPTRTLNTPAGDQTVDFPARLNRHAVSGRILDERGRAIQGATLTLSGAQSATTTSDADGNYRFAGLAAGGNYAVNASGTRHTFAAPSLSFTDLDGDKTADFNGTSLFYAITGRVVDSANRPVTGLSVALSGGRTAAAATDSQGNFAFADLPRGGGFTVTPAKLVGSTFTPASKTFDNLTADQTVVFTAVPTEFKIGGRVTSGGVGLSGVAVALSGSKLAAATTDSAGAYSFNVPVHGDFAVAPSKTHYTFDRASATFTGVNADKTADFVATIKRYKLTGSVKRPNGSAMAGVTVSLTGGQAGAATTDANGAYTFTNLPAGAAYTVTPVKPGYDFAPASRSFTDLGADQTADFTVTPSNVTLSGRATSGGAALAGVTVTLSGSKSGTATTDAQGNYSFTVTSEGSYTVTASKTFYTFAPPSLTFNNPTSARTADFEGTLKRHKITGRVVDKNNAGMAGVAVALTGSLTVNAVTDAQGNYSLTNLLAGGDYAVTASKSHYTFGPVSVPVNGLGADQTVNFTGTLVDYTIGGRVTERGAPLAGVTVTLSGSKSGTATTDSAGAYSFTVPALGSYTLALSKTHYTFAPAGATFASLGGNQAADFNATLNRHAVSGRVVDKNNAGVGGATVTLSGTQAGTATTDAQGNYTFPGLPAGGSYTLSAARANYTFTPASLAVNNLGADSAANNFTGTLLDYALSGRVTSGGAALAGVTVTLSGSKSGTATTDSNGTYSFTVPAEGGYTVTPSKRNYTFAPQARSFNNLSSAQAADFEATLNRYALSGRVAYANDAGLAGVTVTLSGARAATATTDPQGNFSFDNLPAGGNYAVTPALAQHTFAPAARSFEDLSADARATFTAATVEYRVAGRVTEKGAPLAGVEVALAGAHAGLGARTGKVTTGADGAYSFTVPAGGEYTLTPAKKNYGFAPASATFKGLGSDGVADFAATLQAVVGFASTSYTVAEGGGSIIVTLTREGDTSAGASVVYEAEGDTAKRGSDFVSSIGLVTFAPGETTKSFTLFITDDSFVEGAERFTLTLTAFGGAVAGGAGVASVTIDDNDTASSSPNPIDGDEFFVREQYRDFFSREADAPGLKFWTDEIRKCGADAACREARRVSVSAAFFLSIEFQQTGYFVYRLYRATHGRAPSRVGEFMLDSRVVGDGVVVGAEGWAERLAANRRAFLEEWTRRPEFEERYGGFTDWSFLQALAANMNVTLGEARREELLARLAAGGSRAEVLAHLIDDEQFNKQEFRPAFVLMQYFGYLRRGPAEPPDSDLKGYEFWLGKLNEFGGDYEKAEMVKAFLSSAEYRGRFGN